MWPLSGLKLVKVKLKAMKSHEEQVQKMNVDAKSLTDQLEDSSQVKGDLKDFNRRWAVTFEKIGEKSYFRGLNEMQRQKHILENQKHSWKSLAVHEFVSSHEDVLSFAFFIHLSKYIWILISK